MALKDAPADSFNRYMVECKSDYFYYLKQQIDVLIDTWWNVNTNNLVTNKASVTVLIDTWWNVNQASHCISESGRFGFNRYMVECIKCAIEYIRNWTTDEF